MYSYRVVRIWLEMYLELLKWSGEPNLSKHKKITYIDYSRVTQHSAFLSWSWYLNDLLNLGGKKLKRCKPKQLSIVNESKMKIMSCVQHSIEDEVTSQFCCMLAEIYFVRLEDLLINCLPLEGPEDISFSNIVSSGLLWEFQALLKNNSIFYPL